MSASSAISTKRRKIEEGDPGSKTKVETENVEKEFAPKPGMLLLVFGVPEDVNKKGFRHVACKVVRKAQVELLKEVRCSFMGVPLDFVSKLMLCYSLDTVCYCRTTLCARPCRWSLHRVAFSS
jgi:hypothetical protein